MDYNTPKYCISRPDGRIVPLIAVDELPEFLVFPGISRGGYQANAPGTVVISGCHWHAGRYHPVTINSPAGSFMFDGAGNLTGGDAQLWNHGRRFIGRKQKEYCSHWIRLGECDFVQQGCKYKHEMPLDLETLHKLGHRDIPRWYQLMYNVPSLLPRQEVDRPVTETRQPMQGMNPMRGHLPPLLEGRERLRSTATPSSSMEPQATQPMPMVMNSNTSLAPPGNFLPWTTAPQSLQDITADMPMHKLRIQVNDQDSRSPSQEKFNAKNNDPFAGYLSSYPSWNGSLLSSSSQKQLAEKQHPSKDNLSVVDTSIDSGLTTPSSLPVLRRDVADIRRSMSTRNLAAPNQESTRPFPYRPGVLPSISSPNLAADSQNLPLSARPSVASLTSEFPAVRNLNGRNVSGTHYALSNLN